MFLQKSAIEVVQFSGIAVIVLIVCVMIVIQVLPKVIALIVDFLLTAFGIVLGVLFVYILIALA